MSDTLHQLAESLASLHNAVQALASATDRTPYADQMIRNASLDDLVKLTGQSRDWCKEQIRNGQLPGRRIGDRDIIPDMELHLWRLGQWEPRPQQRHEPIPLHPVPPKQSTG